MSITLRQLEVFRAVAEEKSFTRASHRLLVSQSTISEHIRQLEELIKTRVVDRNRRSLALSPAGEHFLVHSRRILQLLEEAEVAARTATATEPFLGKLSFGCASTALLYRLPPILIEYARKYPRVEFKVISGSLESLAAGLRSRSVDLALVVLPLAGNEFKRLLMFEETFVAVLPIRHPLAKRARIGLEDLANESLILYSQGTNTRKAIDHFLHKRRFAPRIVMELDSSEAIKEMVARDFGVSLMPRSTFITKKRANEMKTFPLATKELKGPLGLVYLRSKPLRLPAQALCELLLKHFVHGNASEALRQ